MNQLADENVQNIKWNQKSPNTNKKFSDDVSDENIVNQDKISEALANNLHLNSISKNNLTNGTDHDKAYCTNESIKQPEHESRNTVPDRTKDVPTCIHCKEAGDTSTETLAPTLNLENSNLEPLEDDDDEIKIVSYESELQMPEIMRIIQKDLSEPYSIYTYRYFIHNWPKLCFLATYEGKCIGAIVCKLDIHRNVVKRGYIAMLAVDEKYRKRKIGSKLVRKAIQIMINDNADEVVLETEITNKPALKLYENLGFVRDKRLFRYYLNGVDALRLKLWLR